MVGGFLLRDIYCKYFELIIVQAIFVNLGLKRCLSEVFAKILLVALEIIVFVLVDVELFFTICQFFAD